MIGTTIGKYRIIGKLGRGGMGTVYKAIDETLDREVAIKALNSDVSDATLMARFRAEATTLARLNHPQIATIFEIYKTDQDLLMVMELVRGETLEQLSVRRGPLAPDQAAGLMAQVLGGLSHAHKAGIVHRDLKPANMMITESGIVKIMDFGIARVLGAEHLTSDGTMIGTPAYMAPEQIVGKEIDARADLYSAGVVLYRLLTGCLPFQADTPISMVQKQLWDPPTPVRSHRADLPEWCDTLLTRALEKSPGDRFQTADSFRAALLAAGGAAAERFATDSGTYALSAFAAPTAIASAPVVINAPGSVSPAEVASEGPTVTLVRSVTPEERAPATEKAAGAPAVSKPADTSPVPPRMRRPVPIAAAGVAALVIVAAVAGLMIFRRGRAVPATSAQAAPAAIEVDTPPETSAGSVESTPAADAAVASAPADAPGSAATSVATAGGTASVVPPKPPAKPAPVPVAAPPPSVVDADAASATSTGLSTSAPEPTPTPAASAAAALPPVVFSAQAVVVEGGKNRQRDTNVELANGVVTVTGKDNKLITTVPYDAVVGLTHSNSKQPMWNTPQGPAEITHLDGGAFGFLKGDQHWVSMRTDSMSLVLRVRDQDSRRVISALEERIGKKVEQVDEHKAR